MSDTPGTVVLTQVLFDALLGERDALAREVHDLRAALAHARRELWWFIERDTGEGWGFSPDDVDEIAGRAMAIQDDVLGAALSSVTESE